MGNYKIFFFFFVLAIFLFLPKNVLAAGPKDVVINEVMWMGSSKSSQDGKDEWIELKNNTNQKLQLNGWKVDNLLENKGTFIFPNDPIIEIGGEGFFLVSYYSKADQVENKTILNNEGLVWRCNGLSSCASFSLANSGNGDLVLRDSSGNEIDRALGNPWPAGKKESGSGICYSMERINPLSDGSDVNNWATATEAKNLISGVSDKATPESENGSFSAPAINDYSNISISEYLPYPESSEEWVELYNDNDFEVNLNGWYIDDVADGGSSPKPISGTISANNYKQFYLGSAYLNNDGDDVRLLNGNQNEKDKTSFESSTKGKSWSKDNDGNWCQVDPTPNSSNPDCPEENEADSSSPTATPTSTPTPTKKPTPTLKPSPTSTPAGEILGEEESATNAFYPLEATEEAESTSQSGSSFKTRWLPKILLGVGFLLLFGAAFWVWYTKLRWPEQESS